MKTQNHLIQSRSVKPMFFTGVAAVMLAAGNVRGALYIETFDNLNTAIPVGSPVGISFSGSVDNVPSGLTVGGLTVGLNISGGYDGSLFAYLVAPNGAMVVLLNQPGVTAGTPFGNGGSGMNITLADGGMTITAGSDLTGGTYAAGGALSGFNGSAVDGTWTLYFADLTSGGGTSTLNSWSLGITAVPEPVNVALGVFGGLFAIGGLAGWSRCVKPPR